MSLYKTVFVESESSRILVKKLATRIGELLETAVRQQGRASLVVSGGTTPVFLFDKLSVIDITWKKVTLTLADERWVAPDNKSSNEHLVRTHLLKSRAAAAQFIGLKTEGVTAATGEEKCSERLSSLPLPLDVVILGMGADGHTASFFPGAEKLPVATDMNSGKICTSIAPLTAPHERMTLTLPFLLNSRHIFLHIEGMKKRQVYEKAIAGEDVQQMPIRMILSRAENPVSVYWAP